jgi:enoyl-CoA hydratase
MTKPFTIEIADHIATLWLSRPERRNAMGPAFWSELPGVVEELDKNDDVRVVILAAQGKHFTVGLDLVEMGAELGPVLVQGGMAYERKQLFLKILTMRKGFDAIANSNKPFIAAVHGACIGGGLDMIAACDMRIAAENASFSLRETKIAMVADVGSLQRLEGIIGKGHMRELAFTGKDINAQHALRIQLVNHVVPESDLLAEAKKLAAEIASNSPLAVQGTKEVLRFGERYGAEAGLHFVAAWNASQLSSADLQEAMTAFMSKRSPEFKGRLSKVCQKRMSDSFKKVIALLFEGMEVIASIPTNGF